ncbi:MAG: lipopolysaccharide heptosyltransferase II [Planctomycetota bacterium]
MLPWVDKQIAEREFENVLVRVPNPLGDQIMATPALDSVRRRYPNAHITGFGTENAFRIFEGGTWFDDFITIGRREKTMSQVRKIRSQPRRYDACLLMTGSLRTAIVPFIARIPHRMGYRWSGRTALLTASWSRPRTDGKRSPYPTKTYFNDLVTGLGCEPEGRIRLATTPEVVARSEEWMSRNGIDPKAPLLPMCVGAAFGPSKLWPAEYFAKVADHMIEKHGMTVLLLVAPSEAEIGEAVQKHAKHELISSDRDPLAVDLMKAVIQHADVLLTNDTGPRHVAAAFRRPIVCVMGPTSPVYTETDNEETTILREEGIDCSPCHLKECPIDHRCMVRITPDRAIAALEEILTTR